MIEQPRGIVTPQTLGIHRVDIDSHFTYRFRRARTAKRLREGRSP